MTAEDYKLIGLIALAIILTLIIGYLTFNIVQGFNDAHFQAVNECVELNKAANATVCLV